MAGFTDTIPGIPELTEAMYGSADTRPGNGDEWSHAYHVVEEMLEYFDSHNLATWAPVAAIIVRERNAVRVHPTHTTPQGGMEGR